ncbi:hypothetical protein [uncultured Marixanthomonas sp.]|uniref:hypothetical protein n=1 Tax=uncultured Marixanthomonas sp. TaxID=757245 RepID=UPI0030D705A1|tara:strand:- start:16775 stop:16996 length:222 start_codon:yes stop_codon:yes gene_type:complete
MNYNYFDGQLITVYIYVNQNITVMENDKKNNSEKQKQSIEEQAINKKGQEADGKEINHQVKQRKEQHQPRDTA